MPVASRTATGPRSSYPTSGDPPTFSLLSHCFAHRRDATFTGLLQPEFFQDIADRHDVHFGSGKADTFNAPVTTWAWLTQVLSPVKSCVAASARVLVLCVSLQRPLPSANPGAFGKARGKLPAGFVKDLALTLGQSVERQALP